MERRSPLVRLLWGIAFVVAALWIAKTYVADVYRVRSRSMEPTIHGDPDAGENVLVQYDRAPELERFDLVVVRRPLTPQAVVKRVAGLPGETVQIVGGDLVVDGRRLGPLVPRPRPVPLFGPDDVEDVFHLGQAPDGPWTRDGDVWTVEARQVALLSNAGMMFLSPDVRDEYVDSNGERREGLRQVGDVVLETEFSFENRPGRLRFGLVEEGDTFEAVLDRDESGACEVRLERWRQDQPAEVLESRETMLAADTWHRLRFRNVDNGLVLELGDVLLSSSYAGNQVYPGPTQAGDKSVGARASLGAAGLRCRFRSIAVARDLHYTDQGTFGVTEAVTLGPAEYFLLGDNSGDSRDSRFWGPVRADELIGRPRAVLWPWSARRRLEGAVPLGPDE